MKNILVLLVLLLTVAHANEVDIPSMPEYQQIQKMLKEHDICQEDRFGIIVFNTLIGYYTKGDCSAVVEIAVSKNGSFSLEGNDLEEMTMDALSLLFKHDTVGQLNTALVAYNNKFNTIDEKGYRQCGASGLFAIMGIEMMSKEMQFLQPYLNKDEYFDCFGKALLDNCKAAEFTLMSYLGREFDMHFKIQNEAGMCSLVYSIPIPTAETIEAYKNAQIFPDANKTLPRGKTIEGKLDDIYGFINSKDNHINIDKDYFENEYGPKEKNRGTFAFFTIMVQAWQYFLMGM